MKVLYVNIALIFFVTASCANQIVQLQSYAGGFNNIPIAVIDFKAHTAESLSVDQPWLVVADDLAFCGRFEVTRAPSADSLLSSGYTAGLLIDGEYLFNKDTIDLTCNLRDLYSNEVIYSKKYSTTVRELRRISHRFSNEIYNLFFEEQGPFESRILFIKDHGANKNVFVMDYDGRGSHQVISTQTINIFPCFLDTAAFLWISYLNGKPDIFKGSVFKGTGEPFIFSRYTETSPAVSMIEGKIAYASSSRGNLDIFVCDLDGSGKKQLTFDRAIDTSPCWAPHGYQIAFISDRTGTPQVYIMDSEGSNVRRLTYEGNYQDSPAWSPRADKIAYTSLRNGKYDIWIIDIDGSEPAQVTSIPGNNEYPAWSPEGSHIAFQSRHPGRCDIYAIRPDGSGLIRLTNSGKAKMPDWSPF